MSISVCIPAYNAAGYLRETIESALAQTHPPDEIIVVDDGSTDDTRKVCAAFGSKVRYIYQENDRTFGAGARARAMREAKGEWIALLDHDDRWLPTKLEKQIEASKSQPEAVVVFTEFRLIDAQGAPIGDPKHLTGAAVLKLPHDTFHLLLCENPYIPSSALIRRSIILEDGLTDPALAGCADWDLWLGIARSHPILLLDESLTEYRISAGQFMSDKRGFAEALELTIEAQRARLHPDCLLCGESFRRARSKVYGISARYWLDQYHAAANVGDLRRAFACLLNAARKSPGEVFRPRRLLAVLKNAVSGLMRGKIISGRRGRR